MSSDKQNVDSWKTALKEICVLEGFLEEYKILKTIGKGSFAKVNKSIHWNLFLMFY